MKRRHLLAAAGAAALPLPAFAQDAAARTLRVIPQANLTSLDPVWTTAVVTRNHAAMVYDQLVGVDENMVAKPQMVAGWAQEDGGKSWTFTLRDGLKFHDNEPVRAEDCVASIKRWMARDTIGQTLAERLDEVAALDDKRFRFRLKKPFPSLLDALAKPEVSPLFIMPARIAATDPFQQIRDPIGSGPFRFVREEWNPGQLAVWTKFDGYVPRDDAPSATAGRKQAVVDRVEWTIIPDPSTAAAAIANGEHDYWEYPLHDLLPTLRRNRNVVVQQRLANGFYGFCRFNHLHPPFSNKAVRQAVMMAADQRDYLRAVAGEDPAGWGECPSYFTCGTPASVMGGQEALQQRSMDRARQALKAAGYNGEKTVLITPSDYPQINALSLVTADLLQRMGFNLEIVAADWGTVVQRRASREPVEKGGWSVFHTTAGGGALINPALNQFTRTNGLNAWFGWPTDGEMERLRLDWFDADGPEQVKIAQAIQTRAFDVVPYVPLGFYWQPSVWRSNVTGVTKNFITSFWNIGKS